MCMAVAPSIGPNILEFSATVGDSTKLYLFYTLSNPRTSIHIDTISHYSFSELEEQEKILNELKSMKHPLSSANQKKFILTSGTEFLLSKGILSINFNFILKPMNLLFELLLIYNYYCYYLLF